MKYNCELPVLAPDGTAARNRPKSVTRSTSTVGFPLESKMLRAKMLFIGIFKYLERTNALLIDRIFLISRVMKL